MNRKEPVAGRGAPGRASAVRATGLSKRFGAVNALINLDLHVRRAEVLGLIGPNGAGKTTTMRLLLDLLRPTSGSVRVLGLDPRESGAELRRRLAYLPGELRLPPRVRAGELLAHYARLAGDVPPGRLESLAERLDLDLSRQLGALSRGNKQKVGLVQAFMRPAELLILDEPTSGLDPLVQREFLNLVREAQAGGAAVLLSSHVLSEIQQVADRAAILRRGELARVASVAELRANAPRRLRLQVPRAKLEAAQGALARLSGVTSIMVSDTQGALSGAITARYGGAPRPLLELLAVLPTEDVTISEPELEDAVMALYQGPDSAAQGARELE